MCRTILATILPEEPRGRPRIGVVVTVSLLLLGLLGFLNLGSWLIVEDPLERSVAIAVLSGRMPSRALEAARIYKQGYAPQVWLTHSTEPAETMEKLGVPYTGEESYNKLVLMKEGVPESAIQSLDPPILNTADEMKAIGQALAKDQGKSVILVTSKVHTRRTRTLWRLISLKDGQAIVRGVRDDDFDARHWWRKTTDALDVVREVLGLINAWAGLPVRPAA
jgi:uncharacterized SAM-binding protein YcdF (DUF218 family)